ncbi:MAG TPA: bifunctional lysylphosphatidylglycerol flippase/synthetase MprF [Vicinamibacterales bacterium]|nr:bifunctional lysylphosphatidylglycerol flippase/synthetase MprF [Vicinamibacterales bacterium]
MATRRSRHRLRHLEGATLWILSHAPRIWPAIAVALVLWASWGALRGIRLREVRAALHALDARWLLGACLATALNVGVMGLYDVVAFRRTRSSAAARWRYGAVAFAWSNFLTLGPLAGPAIRFWLYAPAIDRAADLQGGVVAIAIAFVSGLAGWVIAIVVTIRIGAGLGACTAIAFIAAAAVAAGARAIVRRLERLAGPGFDATRFLEMALIGWLDWLLAAAAFLCALHAVLVTSPLASVRTFFFGQVVGLVSLVPGGFGSADAFWIARLPMPGATAAAIVAVFRVIYYVLPWAIASLLLLSWATRREQRRIELARRAVAGLTGGGGLLILLSAASPALHARLLALERFMPLPIVELGQLTAAMAGLLLLALARGLARGYRAAFRATLVLLALAAVSAIAKGLDWEEAVVLGGLAIAAAAHAGLFTRQSHGDWFEGSDVAIAMAAVAVFVVYGALTHRTGFAAFGRWTDLGYRLEASRFARSAIALALAAVAAAAYVAMRVPVRFRRPSEGAIDRALDLFARIGGGTTPLMLANGDKSLFVDGERGVCGYRTIGPYLVVFADPAVRSPQERADFLDALFLFAGDLDRRPLFYQMSPEWIPPLHDRGYVFFKLGEEARVPLARVSLDGHEGKMYRQILRRGERDGVRFRVMPPDETAARLDELQAISDDWLRSKAVSERQFSIGFFDRAYMARFPCAVVEGDDGARILAFANLLRGPNLDEISVDLMRYRSDGPKVMDFLFACLLLHAKDLGYRRFNLGMAPLASVGDVKGAHPRERLARLLFQHGEHWYNFQGLRSFKQKFAPDWEPRYMGYQSAWEWPVAIACVSALIAGGWTRIVAAGEPR